MKQLIITFFLICGVLHASNGEKEDQTCVKEGMMQLETNEYYKARIGYKSFDFYRQFVGGTIDFQVFGLKGGSHLGVLYLYNERSNFLHRLEIGPIYGFLTHEDTSHLNENQVILISTTGGTNVHDVFGCLLELQEKELKIISILPLYGGRDEIWPPLDPIHFSYNVEYIKFLEKGEKIIALAWKFDLRHLKEKDQKKFLKENELDKSFGTLQFKINDKYQISMHGASKHLKERFESILNLSKDRDFSKITKKKISCR